MAGYGSQQGYGAPHMGPPPNMMMPPGSAPVEQASIMQLVTRKKQLEDDLLKVERQIFNLEASYLEETAIGGNVLKGWENYLSARKQGPSASALKKAPKIQDRDRLFSYSSATSSKASSSQSILDSEEKEEEMEDPTPRRKTKTQKKRKAVESSSEEDD